MNNSNLSKCFDSHNLGERLKQIPLAKYRELNKVLGCNGVTVYRRHRIREGARMTDIEAAIICDFLQCSIFELLNPEVSLLDCYMRLEKEIEEAASLASLQKVA